MKVFIILGLAAIAISVVSSMKNQDQDYSHEWEFFKDRYNRIYYGKEEKLRRNLFSQNMKKIRDHNELYKKGQFTYRLNMNQFGDMDMNEIFAITKGLIKNHFDDGNSMTFSRPENMVIPSSIDWRKKGAVTPVKDQRLTCRSCWAFSSTGALEGQHFRKTGKLVSLSEQNLIDCSNKFGNYGCGGGFMDQAFQYIKSNVGIDTGESYPYEAKNGKCRYTVRDKGATNSDFVNIPVGDEKALTEAVATVGPVSVGIDASPFDFVFYQDGVLYEPTCSSENVNHGALAVGFNTTKEGVEYWIVKNSWGTSWGQGGYVWMARNKDNNCGIASLASYPLV